MTALEVVVAPDGTVQMVYSDDLAEVFAGEAVVTRRASHVEPVPYGWPGGWYVDLGPVGGPRLFANCEFYSRDELAGHDPVGFTTRQAALDAEATWLRARMAEGTVGPCS